MFVPCGRAIDSIPQLCNAKQPPDRCLSEYVNAANHLLRSYATDEFTAALNQNLDYIYVYVALVSTNTITVTA